MSSERPVLRIAVVVPTRNRHAPLLRALKSVERQTRVADEVLVVDDASDPPIRLDASDPFLASVRVVRLDAPQGAGAARNAGVNAAASPIVAFLDSDDLYLDTHLEDVETGFLQQPEAAFVATRILVADDAMTPFARFGSQRTEITHAMLLERGNVVGTFSAIAVARARFVAVGGIPPIRSYQDWALTLALTEQVPAVNVVRPSVVYRSPLLSTLGGISKDLDQHLSSYRFIAERFDFARSARSRAFYHQNVALLLATGGQRGQALRHLLAAPASLAPDRRTAMIALALILGRTGYRRMRRANALRKRAMRAISGLRTRKGG